MLFPKGVRNKNTLFSFEGFVLSDSLYPNALYVISIENKGEVAFWKGKPLSKVLTEKKTWFFVSDSVLVPADVTKTGKLKVYLWNAGRKSRVLVDDLSVSFKQFVNPSFLEDIDSVPEYSPTVKGIIVFENSFFQVWERQGRGFLIKRKLGDTLVDALTYFFNYRSKGKVYHDFSIFKYTRSKSSNGKTILKFEAKSKLERVNLELACSANSPNIGVTLKQRFRQSVTVTRSALLLKYSLPLKEVFRANRKTDERTFQNEYWLDREGFLAGNDSVSLAIYHTPKLSSLQLDTKRRLAVINLDYEKDHPYLQFPLNADTFNLKVDESTAVYKKHEVKTSFFKIFAGIKTEPLPRMMKNPDGFLAAYIWTEHADWSDIRTHRATYFGSEKITSADSATGGFVKYRIPVTKSVFYDNPDSITNTLASDSLFSSLESSIVTDSAFGSFLSQISKKGDEICLHTPEQFTTTPKRLEDALVFMKNQFNTTTWIDHGYNNQPQNNREDFVCSGPQNYAAKLWKKYDIRYFWNPWYEDYQTFLKWGFFGSIEKYYNGFGDFYPKPDYWQHPTRTSSFYHWPTYSVTYMEKESLWEYFFSEQQFHVFTDSWGVEINHCYPAWASPGKGFWKFDTHGVIVAMDGFNRTLQRMARYRDEGKLNVTTVKQFLNYQLAIEQVSYDVLPDGRIRVVNHGDRVLKGLSFAVQAKYVTVDGLGPYQKKVDDNLLFWFNLEAGEAVLIRVIE